MCRHVSRCGYEAEELIFSTCRAKKTIHFQLHQLIPQLQHARFKISIQRARFRNSQYCSQILESWSIKHGSSRVYGSDMNGPIKFVTVK